jgi:Wzt-like putative exopolysaccharide export protein
VVSRVRFHEDVPRASVGFRVQTVGGTGIIGDTTVAHGINITGRRGTQVVVRYDFTCRLSGGSYLLGGGVSEVLPGGHLRNLHFVRGVSTFTVEGRLLNALVDPGCTVSVENSAGGESDPLAAA